jgi:hypothetical protein
MSLTKRYFNTGTVRFLTGSNKRLQNFKLIIEKNATKIILLQNQTPVGKVHIRLPV